MKEKPAFDTAFLDTTLRPTVWDEYIGQNVIKDNIRILLKSAEIRGELPEHMLFYGSPGLGKTTLAHLIAHETGRNLRVTSGPAIEKGKDLVSILMNIAPGDILFIDEIHRLNKTIEEMLYPAMESGKIEWTMGEGPSARIVELPVEPFTLVGATTRISMISAPLRSRFSGGVFRLEFYSEKELSEILARSATRLNIEIPEDGLHEIAKRARFTPRIANYLLRRARDYAMVHESPLHKESVDKALSLLEIDNLGLTALDRSLLTLLIQKERGAPVGLKTLAATLGEEEETLEEVNEPYLIQVGLMERTPRGRIATEKAYIHLDR